MSANVPKHLVVDLNQWYLAKEEGETEWDSRILSTSARAAAIYHADAVAERECLSVGDEVIVVVKDVRSGEETTWDIKHTLAIEAALRAVRVSG